MMDFEWASALITKGVIEVALLAFIERKDPERFLCHSG